MNSKPSRPRTITLSDRAPVVIDDVTWPLITKADYVHDERGPTDLLQLRWSGFVRVHRHHDQRAVIAAGYDFRAADDSMTPRSERCGRLVEPSDDLAKSILGVCDELHMLCGHEWVLSMARKAIAGLPPERLV